MKSFFIPVVCLLMLNGCKNKTQPLIKANGKAQGTTYQVTWFSDNEYNYQKEIDSVFKTIDLSLSTYVPASIISKINKNDTPVLVDKYFTDVYQKAMEVSEKTNGLFDITIAPVINAWGFGFTKKAEVDSSMIDSLLNFVGYKKIKLEGNKLLKEQPQMMLDFNAIAQGYTVDVIAGFLESKGIKNYLVELGGEVKTKGRKPGNVSWKIGIDQPVDSAVEGRPLKAIIKLDNRALATSGNYRKFYILDGKKYAHIIDPHTGYPAKHNLLSASVLADDCMTADAYATAFMVMGVGKAKEFLASHRELTLDVFFIYDNNGVWETYSSEGLKNSIEEIR
ncbi:FAD:protein FMN transferase [soil metagenome]